MSGPNRSDGLPVSCPDWCISDHERALREGCHVESARTHMSADRGGALNTITDPDHGHVYRPGGGMWQVSMDADPGDDGVATGYPLIEFETSRWDDAGEKRQLRRVALDLTSGEARVLASQLVWLADAADLPRQRSLA